MKLSIRTTNGISKAVFDGCTLTQLSEQDLESLRVDIWVALQEIDLAREHAEQYEHAQEVR